MKIDYEAKCDVIKDLLPLYQEGLLSEASVELVEAHLKTCSACKKKADTSINDAASLKGYENIEGSEETATRQADIETFKKIRKKISRGKIKGILLAILGSLVMVILLITYLTAPNYLPYDEDRVRIVEGAGTGVYLELGEEVAGYNINRYENDLGTRYNYRITTWDNLWSGLFSQPNSSMIPLNPEGETVGTVFYYTTDGQLDQVIYGGNPYRGSMTLPRLALNYYVKLAAFCFLLFLLFRKLFQKKPGLKRFFEIGAMFFGSYVLAHGILHGLNATTYSMVRDFAEIMLLSVTIFMILLVLRTIFKKHRSARVE